jgi:hypothetical protein
MSIPILEEQPTAGSQLSAALGQGLGQGLNKSLENFFQRKEISSLERKGIPGPLASLIVGAPTGAKTEIYKMVLDQMQRGEGPGSGLDSQDSFSISETSKTGLDDNVTSSTFTESEDFEVEEPNFKEATRGMTPKEKERYKSQFQARSFERNKKYLNRISDISAEIPKETVALQQMRAALDSGDFGNWNNVLAELTGLEFLKNAPAQTVNAATKQYLMSSLAGITGRPNQFIEQQITKASINPQYREAANELIYDGMKGLADLKNKEVEIAQKIEGQFSRQGKEVPRNFQEIVKKELKKSADKFEKDYEKSVREKLKGMGPPKGFDMMRDLQGNLRQVPSEQRDEALKAGYKLQK